MIKTENLQKIFKTEEVETWALHDVTLDIKEGEFVAIMGPSGCGKSTLLNILGLLDNPTSGNYQLNGVEVSKMTESQRTELRKGVIGFVFQSFNLIDASKVIWKAPALMPALANTSQHCRNPCVEAADYNRTDKCDWNHDDSWKIRESQTNHCGNQSTKEQLTFAPYVEQAASCADSRRQTQQT